MILFVHTGFSTFVSKDYEILTKHFPVRSFQYRASRKLTVNMASQIGMLAWLLWNIWHAKCLYIWFADYHSLLPVVFGRISGKKSVLVLGGYDVTHIPEIAYGSFSNPVRGFCARWTIENASFVLPVDESLIEEARARVVRISGRIVPAATGYSPKVWYREREKGDLVLTVGLCDNMRRVKLKGIDFFLEVARNMQECRFVVIGLDEETRELLSPSCNVQLMDRMTPRELRRYYSEAKVYAQFSLFEGLPNVLCEAMLCECVPVGTNVSGIPTAIGDCGFILEERDVHKAVSLVDKALNSPESLGMRARQRIADQFPAEKRERALKGILDALLG